MIRNNLCVHTETRIGQKLPVDWEAKVIKFRKFVQERISGVEELHVGNMDEVPVSFDLPTARTVNLKGEKEVSITQQDIKSQISLLYCA